MKTTAIICAFLAITANAGPVGRRQAAGGNLQTLPGSFGGVTAPAVINVGGGLEQTFKAAQAAGGGNANAEAGAEAGAEGQAGAGAAANKNKGGAAGAGAADAEADGQAQQKGEKNNAGGNQDNENAVDAAGGNAKGNNDQEAGQGNAAGQAAAECPAGAGQAAGQEDQENAAGQQGQENAAGNENKGNAAGKDNKDNAAGQQGQENAAGNENKGNAAGQQDQENAAGKDNNDNAAGQQDQENAAAGQAAGQENAECAAPGNAAGAEDAAQGDAAAGAAAGGAAGAAAGGAAAGAAVLPDGRIAQDAVPEDFNVLASPFKSAVVKGDGLVFSDVITFPDIQPSIFDAAGNTKAFEISINDQSIFVPQGQAPQDQFRRADLLPSIASTLDDVATTGKKTMHFSLQQDPAKPLALATNEYQVAFLETADFESRIFDVRVGTGTTSPSLTGENIVVLGRSGENIQEMFVAPFSTDMENFAVTLDFDQNTMQVFHSTGQTPLEQVSEAVANDNSGNGEYHFAVLKLADAQGQQAAGIDEGLAFAGIFMEDSADGTVTLQ